MKFENQNYIQIEASEFKGVRIDIRESKLLFELNDGSGFSAHIYEPQFIIKTILRFHRPSAVGYTTPLIDEFARQRGQE